LGKQETPGEKGGREKNEKEGRGVGGRGGGKKNKRLFHIYICNLFIRFCVPFHEIQYSISLMNVSHVNAQSHLF